ncbi:hypothetical protein BH18ACT4_BH18ACT4_03370 [soil metagenome]
MAEETSDDAAGPEPEPEPVPETVYGAPVTMSRGQKVAHPARETLADLVGGLRAVDGFKSCVDVTAVDYYAHPGRPDLPAGVRPERYEVVVSLLSHTSRTRLRLRVQVPEDDPVVPSLFDIHPGTEALEREVFDLFGIRFDGHPDMTRIIMPEDWIGHPLRKDYAIGAIPVQFKGVADAR